MEEKDLDKMRRSPYTGPLLLPKYQRIVQKLYIRANERDRRTENEVKGVRNPQNLYLFHPHKDEELTAKR